MSMGYGGYMNLVESDEAGYLYTYCAYNLNLERHCDIEYVEDGKIFIPASSLHLSVSEVKHNKASMPPTRVVDVDIDYDKISITRATGEWLDYNMIASRLLFKFLNEYKQNEEIPTIVSMYW